MKVLRVKPGEQPEAIEIENTLEALQNEVGGYIECHYLYWGEVLIVCNEEGKLLGLEPNQPLRNGTGAIVDWIHGTFLILGFENDEFCGLTADEIQKYSNRIAIY